MVLFTFLRYDRFFQAIHISGDKTISHISNFFAVGHDPVAEIKIKFPLVYFENCAQCIGQLVVYERTTLHDLMTVQFLAGLFFEISKERAQIVAAVDDLVLSDAFFHIAVFFAADRQSEISPVISSGQIDIFAFRNNILALEISQSISFHILSDHLIIAGVIADGIDRQTVAHLTDVQQFMSQSHQQVVHIVFILRIKLIQIDVDIGR